MSRLAEAFLDAVYAIALSAPGDQFHARAEELAEQMERDGTKIITVEEEGGARAVGRDLAGAPGRRVVKPGSEAGRQAFAGEPVAVIIEVVCGVPHGQGGRDTFDAQPTGGPDDNRTTRSTTQADRRNQPDDVGTAKNTGKAALKSLRSPHSTPHLRITPEGEPSTGKPNYLYRASEVIAWADKRRERKSV